MKKVVFVALAALTLIACNKEDNNDSQEKISDWSGGEKVAEASVSDYDSNSALVGSTNISADGTFTFPTLAAPPASFLTPIDPTNVSENITISDLTVQGADFTGLKVYSHNVEPTRANCEGYLFCGKFIPHPILGKEAPGAGSFEVSYMYVNKNLSITGTETQTNISDNITITTKNVSNAHLKSGWNKVYMVCTQVDINFTTMSINITVEATTTPQDGGTWRYEAARTSTPYSKIHLASKQAWFKK